MTIKYEQLKAKENARIDVYVGVAITMIIILIGIMAQDVNSTPSPTPSGASENRLSDEVEATLVPDNTYQVSVTCFSSVECNSGFCKRNKGKPRGLRVAIDQSSPVFGGHRFSQVYIPAYDKKYSIMPETATGVDIDIWVGDDYDYALRCGNKKLLVNFIK